MMDIFEACRAGDLAQVKQLNPTPNELDQKHFTGFNPLDYAIMSDNMDLCEFLLAAGSPGTARIRVQPLHSLLQKAASIGHLGLVRHFASKNHDLNQKDSLGRTLPEIAQAAGFPGVADLLTDLIKNHIKMATTKCCCGAKAAGTSYHADWCDVTN